MHSVDIVFRKGLEGFYPLLLQSTDDEKLKPTVLSATLPILRIISALNQTETISRYLVCENVRMRSKRRND